MSATEVLALIIEDEPQIRRAVKNAMRELVDRVIETATGAEGIDAAAAEQPTLVILDLALPDQSGLTVCTEVRRWSQAAIIVLSAKSSPEDKALLLDAGADDYITKPFSTVELQARIRAQLRRHKQKTEPEHAYHIDGLEIDVARRIIERNGEYLHLTPTEWDLLRTLVMNANRTLTHRQLFSSVWGRSPGDPQQYLRVYVANLRRKIERDPVRPTMIITEPGVGYRFQLPR